MSECTMAAVAEMTRRVGLLRSQPRMPGESRSLYVGTRKAGTAKPAAKSNQSLARQNVDDGAGDEYHVGGKCANLRVEMTVCGAVVATRDLSDRAHDQTEVDTHGARMLVPAAKLGGTARPRRYPAHQMTSRGVAFDSAYDELHERQLRLDGVVGVGKRRGGRGGETTAEASRAEIDRMKAGRELLDRSRRVYTVGTVEQLADRYLREGRITLAEWSRLVEGQQASGTGHRTQEGAA